jgi:small subunit ribosomal protein S16
MAVVIRMRRTGRKNRPCYRINVADSRFPRDGRLLETIGLYDPIRRDTAAQVSIDAERARHWIANGARVTDTVASLFRRHGVFEPKPPAQPRERPGRKKTTATRKHREESQKLRSERKQARFAARKKEKKAAAAATPAAT